MKHAVWTINKSGQVIYEGLHQTADSAYEEYEKNIGIVRKFVKKGEEYTVARVNDGKIMAMEIVKGE